MPDIRPIDRLRLRLDDELAPGRIFHATVWGNPRAMSEALKTVKRDLSSGNETAPPSDVLKESLEAFAGAGRVANFTQLKHVCYGLNVTVEALGCRLIDNEPLLTQLLDLVEKRQAQPRQFRRCYQGLLNSYFLASDDTARGKNWAALRTFLDSWLDAIVSVSERSIGVPDWLGSLLSHRNLLGDEACNRYASELAQGRFEGLESACRQIGIPRESWVWQDGLLPVPWTPT
jgi:hypothetical protein